MIVRVLARVVVDDLGKVSFNRFMHAAIMLHIFTKLSQQKGPYMMLLTGTPTESCDSQSGVRNR